MGSTKIVEQAVMRMSQTFGILSLFSVLGSPGCIQNGTSDRPAAENETEDAGVGDLEDKAGDLCPNDPNKTVPGKCGCGKKEPFNTSGYRDAQGYACSGWQGYDCTRASEQYGYTAAQEASILANCSSSCGTCPGGTTTPPPSDLCPDDPSKTAPGKCGCGKKEPFDVSGYRDAQGYLCSEWQGYDCTQAAEQYGYTAAQEANIVANCSSSCAVCPGGTAPPPVDQCPNDPNKTEPGQCGCGVPEGQCGGGSACGSNAPAPQTYKHIVVFSFENRTWNDVGMGFSSMSYLRSLANQCSYFSGWNETNGAENSLTQYVGVTSGVSNTSTSNDCTPSPSCRSTDNNIFRQVRLAGGTARNYVEGASGGCSASGNAAKHVPALYYYGTYSDSSGTHNDHDFCNTEVRPYSEFNVNNLPTFAWITPTMCNDGHDCGNGTVDNWAKTNIQRVIDSAAYKAGTVAIFVWYDEDRPVPNLTIAPTSHKGKITSVTGSHAALLKTMETMLGLSVMNQGQLASAPNLRSYLGI